MVDSSWALDGSVSSAGVRLLDDLVPLLRTNQRHGTAVKMLRQWGEWARTLDVRDAFAATADNVVVSDEGFRLDRKLPADVDVLDRGTAHARICWHLALRLVVAGAGAIPTEPVDELCIALGGRSGLTFGIIDMARAKAHEAVQSASRGAGDPVKARRDVDDAGALTMVAALAQGLIDDDACREALLGAWRYQQVLSRDLSRAEAAAIELAASRELVSTLGDQLERDEWIRARLRTAKATLPARALIKVRKKVLKRS